MNFYDILLAKQLNGGGGEITVEGLSVTENATYTAPEGKAYSPVVVNVPLPPNAHLLKSATSYPITPSLLPLPKAEVTFEGNKAELYVGSEPIVVDTDNKPYVYRQSPQNKSAVDLSLVGGTIAWNQLVQSTDTSCTVPNAHKYIFHHGTTYDVAISDGNAFTVDGSANDNVHDITQAFGSTIADYVYTLEQSTAGSGIAWLKSYGYLTKDYYAYQSGKLESVNVASRKVYDSNDTLLATYNFDATKVLRGIPKLSNGQMYYDGDIYESDGSVTRKYGVVDISTLSWQYNESLGLFYANFSDYVKVAYNVIPNIICKAFVTQKRNDVLANNVNGITTGNVGEYDNRILVRPSNITDLTTFNQVINGVYLVYELATPTTESATPFTNPQLVGSTEEFVDATSRDVMIPCGQDSNYANSDIYISYGTSPIDMAKEHAIIPYASTYIDSNGSEDVEYWD